MNSFHSRLAKTPKSLSVQQRKHFYRTKVLQQRCEMDFLGTDDAELMKHKVIDETSPASDFALQIIPATETKEDLKDPDRLVACISKNLHSKRGSYSFLAQSHTPKIELTTK